MTEYLEQGKLIELFHHAIPIQSYRARVSLFLKFLAMLLEYSYVVFFQKTCIYTIEKCMRSHHKGNTFMGHTHSPKKIIITITDLREL